MPVHCRLQSSQFSRQSPFQRGELFVAWGQNAVSHEGCSQVSDRGRGAQAVQEPVQLVYDTAQKHGVPHTVAAELLAHSRPCIYLLEFDDLSSAHRETARPAARTGGLPSLPDDADWLDGMEPLVLTVDCVSPLHEVLPIELPMATCSSS
ncbi:hypothetical protein [Streptomyces himastatinicus]|uniref:hypothetical protein n=1 Tax=Streptomyces himastatinicus TaxID=998084 RepID=UPI0001B4D58F|nr:hypothetical protein [Streptomyces himastatinicus]